MANAWLDHVKKVRSTMPEGTLLKKVLQEAKKTWKKGTGAVVSAAKSAKKSLKRVVSKGAKSKRRRRKTSKKSKRKSRRGRK